MQIGFFNRHADAIIGHGERLGVLVDLHTDAESRIVPQKRRIGNGQKRSLSIASLALEMISRRNTSLLEYKDFASKVRSLETSV